ncbi:MAG: hypothetical protein ACTSYG_07295 [Candidatus Heimdallarchaeota archaeon]
MSPENKYRDSPSPILHNSLHKYCTIPILDDLHPIQQAILRYLNKFPGTVGSIIYRDLQDDFPENSRRTFYYHQRKLKEMGLVEELTLTKPFPLQLTWAGRQCVQLSSARVNDRRWVRLEKASVVFDILEIYAGDLSAFKDDILLRGKWGRVVAVTNNNWTKIIIRSRFPFFVVGLSSSALVLNLDSVFILTLVMGGVLKKPKTGLLIKLAILRIVLKISFFVPVSNLQIKSSTGKVLIQLLSLKLPRESMPKNAFQYVTGNFGLTNPMHIQKWVSEQSNKQNDNSSFRINSMKSATAYRTCKIISTPSKKGLPTCSSSRSYCLQ